ncbi:MAG TPA: penicillin-binding protein 1C, partial [Burkholderiaceae bacterium]
TIALAPASSASPQIRYPVDGGLIALDPDIPAPRQRVQFRAQGAAGMQWRLDARRWEGDAWQPAPGKHVLELVRADGKVADSVHFEVR